MIGQRSRRTRLTVVSAVAALAVVLSGCEYEDLNSLTLPGVEGTGADSYTITIEFANAMDLVPNSPVLVDDLNVGTVRSVELDGHQPVVTVSLRDDVDLPANAVANIGQTSLLGAKHVEIGPPPNDQPVGELKDGDRIGLDRSDTYPATEEVLAAVSAMLNGGGLQNIRTITHEVNDILGGREDTARDLLVQAREFSAGLDAQRNDITSAIDGLDELAAGFRRGNGTIARALEALPPALQVLRKQRSRLVTTLESLGHFGDLTTKFVEDGGGRALVRNVEALEPTLRGLADAGDSLTDSLWILGTVVFPLQDLDEFIRGDFYNLIITLDLREGILRKGLLEGTPLETLIGTPNGLLGQVVEPSPTETDAPAEGQHAGGGDEPGSGTVAQGADDPGTDGDSGLLGLLLGGGS